MEGLTERKLEKDGKAHFMFAGFTQTAGIRTYAFESIGAGARTDHTVEVNLALLTGYGIRIQELPLLCRELLQQREEPDGLSACVFTEPQMRSHAEKLAIAKAEAAQKRKPPRHLAATPNPGSAWRNSFR
jgi:hypothetical protein